MIDARPSMRNVLKSQRKNRQLMKPTVSALVISIIAATPFYFPYFLNAVYGDLVRLLWLVTVFSSYWSYAESGASCQTKRTISFYLPLIATFYLKVLMLLILLILIWLFISVVCGDTLKIEPLLGKSVQLECSVGFLRFSSLILHDSWLHINSIMMKQY